MNNYRTSLNTVEYKVATDDLLHRGVNVSLYTRIN